MVCGALVHHIERNAAALSAAHRNVDAWTREIGRGGLVAILVTTPGCVAMLKDDGFMLRDDLAYAEKTARVSALTGDIIATGNMGCAMQIARHTSIPVASTVELLDWAAGGSVPPALHSLQQRTSP